MNVLFVAGIAVVAADPPKSRELFVDALGLPLEGGAGDYFHSERVDGTRHFGVWPLTQAAHGTGARSWMAVRMQVDFYTRYPRYPQAESPCRGALAMRVSSRGSEPLTGNGKRASIRGSSLHLVPFFGNGDRLGSKGRASEGEA